MNRNDSVTMTSQEFHRQRVLEQLSDLGIGFQPKKKVRWFEIVTGYVFGIGAIVLLSLIWTRFV